jgi:polar amino acid transport system substrate-binding protein
LHRNTKAFLCAVFIAALAGCAASEPESDLLKAQLAPRGTLRAAINYSNPLLGRRDPATGELSGLAVDLSRELARRVGVEVELIPYDSAGKMAADAPNNVWDIAYLAIDPARAETIDYSAAHSELEGSYLVPAGSPLQTIEDVDQEGVRIASAQGAAYDLFLSRELQRAELVKAESSPAAFDLMIEQKLDALAGVKASLRLLTDRLPGSRVLDGRFMTIPQAAGVPAGRPEAARYVREFIEEMKASGFVAEAFERHGLGSDDAIVAAPAPLE